MALAWLLNLDFAASPSSRAPLAGVPSERQRRRRRYILPDGRVFTDPDRVLYELQRLLTRAEPEAEEAAVTPTTAAKAPRSRKRRRPAEPNLTPSLMSEIVAELPQLMARIEPEVAIDPAIIELIAQRRAEEEALIMALIMAT